MKCLICGGESAGEVCNQCIRLEKIIFQKEWSFKAGLIGKAEDLRVAVSNLRISGRLPMSDNPKALTTRVDDNTSGIRSLNTQVNALSNSLDAITNKVKVLTQEEHSLLDTPDPNTI